MRFFRLKVYRFRCENPSGAGAEIPRQHDVSLDKTQSHVVGGCVMSYVHHQCDLIHKVRHELHGQLETLMDLSGYGVRGERRESADAAREKRFTNLEIYEQLSIK